jgi:phospholipid/cholesterol/gamma-HCH transport system substrate-binding protein
LALRGVIDDVVAPDGVVRDRHFLVVRRQQPRADQVDLITGEIGGVTKNLNSKLDQLEPTLANFKVLSDSLKEIEINGTLKKLQVSLGKMNETLTRMNSDDNTVGKLMTEDTLYHNLNKLLRSIDSLANHLNTNPKHFFGPLGKSQKKIERDLKKQQ